MYTQVMAGKATTVILTEQERNELEVWVRKPTMERRFADRARIVLEAATEKTTLEIAYSMSPDSQMPPLVDGLKSATGR